MARKNSLIALSNKKSVPIIMLLKLPIRLIKCKHYYFRTKIHGGRGLMAQAIVKSPSGSLRISLPAAQFINAMGQDTVKCLIMQSCKVMLGMTHMT